MSGPNQSNPYVRSSNVKGERFLQGGENNPSVNAEVGGPGNIWIKVDKKAAGDGGKLGLFTKQDYGKTTNWLEITTAIIINGTPVEGGTLDLNFINSGVTVNPTGPGSFNVDIPGTIIEKEELLIMEPAETFNFKGVGVLVTQDATDPLQVNVEIPGFPSGQSPFDEKYARFGPRELDQQGSSSNLVFKEVPVFTFANGGTSTGIITVPMVNYQAGDDLYLNLYYIADGSAGGNKNVYTEVSVSIFKVGDDVDLLAPITRIDQYVVSSVDGITYNRPQVYTAAELGNLIDGDYFLLINLFRDGTDPSDKFNKKLNFYAGRAYWEQ